MNRMIIATMMTFAFSGVAWAQDPAHDQHHPPAAASPGSAPAQQTPPAGQQGMMGGMNMMSMMRDMSMMSMMGSMRMMGSGSAGMATIDRIEGRIAFLRAELRITDAQAQAWNAFADALRSNAKKLGEVRASLQPAGGQQQAPALAGRLDAQERWLSARLEGTRAIKAAFTPLYGALSNDQKKTADELLGPHMGMAAMMMPGQPGQMGPGQMGPGQMRPGQMPGPR